MKTPITFDIFLSDSPQERENALGKIKKLFNTTPKPHFDKDGTGSSNRFHYITLDIDEEEIWNKAYEISLIDGVVDVDPDVQLPTKLTLDLEDLPTDVAENRDLAGRPNPNWIHENTRFPEAIEFASQAFKNGEGCFNKNETSIRVAQLDTGYTNHPEISMVRKDLGKNYVFTVWDRVISFFTGKGYTKDARDRVRNFKPFKWGGHGTSTAGVFIGGYTNNTNSDFTNGVFPYIYLVPYRISETIISFNNKMAFAAWQAIKDDCKVITMSHAGLLRKRMWKEAVADAYEAGIIWIAAAGSHIKNVDNIWLYPAKFPETITAAASMPNDTVWEKSFTGTKVDVSAPGFDLYVPYARDTHTFRYRWSEGTSFSTPIVAASAALWLAHHGENKLNALYKEGWQRVEAFRKLLKDSARVPNPATWNFEKHGAGLLDVKKLLELPLPHPSELIHATKKRTTEPKPVPGTTVDNLTNKELTYLTCMAKVHFGDKAAKQDPQSTFDLIKNNASQISKEKLDEIESLQLDSFDELKKEVKRYAEKWNF